MLSLFSRDLADGEIAPTIASVGGPSSGDATDRPPSPHGNCWRPDHAVDLDRRGRQPGLDDGRELVRRYAAERLVPGFPGRRHQPHHGEQLPDRDAIRQDHDRRIGILAVGNAITLTQGISAT